MNRDTQPPDAPLQGGEPQLEGVLERIIFYNEENHFCIGELMPERGRERVTITGTLPGVQCGETLKLEGEWQEHPRFGPQFKVQRYASSLPASVYGMRKFLGSGLVPGIGKGFADKVVDAFGADTLRVIEEDSGRLREVPGIGKKRATEIKNAWDSQRAMRDVMMFLQTYGVTVSQCMRLVRAYGTQAREILRQDPYVIAREIDGIGFKTADRIAINLGFGNDSPERIRAGLMFVLRELEGEGHTGYPAPELIERTATLLEAEPERLKQALRELVDTQEVRWDPEAALLQLPGTARSEQTIADSLARCLDGASNWPSIQVERAIQWAQERAGFGFAPEQSEAIRMVLSHKVSILTGGPGTGKTTILRAVCEILRAKKVRLLLASPTGRAAQRMSQSTGLPAATIHRMLRFDPQGGGFTINESRPLDCDLLVVDEASMLDNWLAACLFRALPANAHLLLVGDIHQLPSVGAGNVLKDLIQSECFAVTELSRVFRQREDSSIVGVAHAILNGRPQPPGIRDSIEELNPRHDFHFLRASSPEDCVAKVETLCARFIPQHYRRQAGLMDCQVLAPMHRGVGGISNLNQKLQAALNPSQRSLAVGSTFFHEGDKVIQTRNNYDKNIFNGDLGQVTQVVPDSRCLAADFDGREVEFEHMELSDLSPAFAISVHKSQGSEFPIVVIPLLKQHFVLLQRNLLYTAITRGRRKVFVVGEPEAYAMAVNNNENRERRTDLARKLRHSLSRDTGTTASR